MQNTIGLDVGGTKITGIVWDGKKVLDHLTIVTPKTLVEFERSVLKLLDFLSADREIFAVGVGIAGLIDVKKGVVIHSPNIKFVKNLQLLKLIKLAGCKTVKIENDARCFALAEFALGMGKGKNTLVGITLGTGIGGGLVSSGGIYHGANFGAGEVGHMVYRGGETFESAFQTARDSRNNKALAQIVGALLTNVYRLVDPEVVVLGGGITMDKSRNFINSAKQLCLKMLSSYKIKPKSIFVSKLKNAGAIGAALLVSN